MSNSADQRGRSSPQGDTSQNSVHDLSATGLYADIVLMSLTHPFAAQFDPIIFWARSQNCESDC